LIAAVAFCGSVVMLFTIAVGAGDTSVGNSSSPWIAGDVIILSIPVAVGAISYVSIRRSGATRGRALAAAVAVPPAMLIVVSLIFWLLISLSWG
jgi:hypothetical protein